VPLDAELREADEAHHLDDGVLVFEHPPEIFFGSEAQNLFGEFEELAPHAPEPDRAARNRLHLPQLPDERGQLVRVRRRAELTRAQHGLTA
jgi:hypothetical protein